MADTIGSYGHDQRSWPQWNAVVQMVQSSCWITHGSLTDGSEENNAGGYCLGTDNIATITAPRTSHQASCHLGLCSH